MGKKLHPAIPKGVTENLDELLEDTRKGLGFKQFDAETSPKVYQGILMFYFFALGNNIHKMGLSTGADSLYKGLLRHLQTIDLIESKPRNYSELRETFKSLCSQTSKYLEEWPNPNS